MAAAARDAERKLSPVSVFISLKTKKLYVRQAYEPIFEADVTIRDPDTPIGTHTFTALDYQPGGRDMRWNVVSIAGRQPGEPEKSSGMNQRKRNQSVEGIPTDTAAADCRARPHRDPARDRRAHQRAGAAGLLADRLR